MKPLFTVHAGEYLVGSHVEQIYPRWHIWIPAKDTGIDLLVTDSGNSKAVSLQVKFSKDFNPTHRSILLQNKLRATGWWTLQPEKIQKSQADFWVFVLPSFIEHETSFIIVPPVELLRRFRAIHGRTGKRINSYLWVTRTARCWEARGLPNAEQELIAFDRFSNESRDFSKYLDAWEQIERKLK
ncbi:hypothetical protein [Candidatus Methylomirabilis sp.]|uniref:hypothetical protein n=1 Tax=Candidatus Methylomirabilis sp. TaxID=2032687 RepID=UPI00307645AF